jgi:hypothetical protein
VIGKAPNATFVVIDKIAMEDWGRSMEDYRRQQRILPELMKAGARGNVPRGLPWHAWRGRFFPRLNQPSPNAMEDQPVVGEIPNLKTNPLDNDIVNTLASIDEIRDLCGGYESCHDHFSERPQDASIRFA